MQADRLLEWLTLNDESVLQVTGKPVQLVVKVKLWIGSKLTLNTSAESFPLGNVGQKQPIHKTSDV